MSVAAAYDDTPYEGVPIALTHPARIGAWARLMGVDAAPADRCRVLELGCGTGWNALALAATSPGARVVGVDAAARQLERGRAAATALELDNLTLVHGDIEPLADDPASLVAEGPFDYVIAHGVYSWVAPSTQVALLRLVAAALAPRGVAFVSYNCLPGWHQRLSLREMMLFHTRGMPDAPAKAAHAIALLDFLAESAPPHETSYRLRLESELEVLRALPAEYVLHDHLAPINTPCHYHELVTAAQRAELTPIGDAQYGANQGRLVPAELAADLRMMSGADPVAFEQYVDFVIDRGFRKTLLVRAEARVAREPVIERIRELHVASAAEPAEGGWTIGKRFVASEGPAMDALLEAVTAAWPESVTVEALIDGARSRDALASSRLLRALDALAGSGLVELLTTPAPVGRIGARPEVAPLVRYELAHDKARLSSRHHRPFELAAPVRTLAALADGTRDATELFEGLVAAVTEGRLAMPADASGEAISAGLAAGVEAGLRKLERLGALV